MFKILAMIAVSWTIETSGDNWAAGGKGDGVFADYPSCLARVEDLAKRNPSIKKAYCLLRRNPDGDGGFENRILIIDR